MAAVDDHRHHHHNHIHGHRNPIDERLLRMIRENQTIDESILTDEEKWRLDHLRLHEKHKGHEEMHAEMVIILLITTIIAQVALVSWKKHHYKSYQFVSMLGVWMVPFVLCLTNHWWRFVFFWLLFSSITIIVVKKAVEKPLDPTTPRQVYKWFFFIYKVCCGLGVIGYVIIMVTMMGFNLLFGVKPNVWMDAGLLFIFYGLYYGVMGRDLAEVCAGKMASHIGYYTPHGMPTRTLEPGICAVCGNPQLVPEGEEGVIENTYRLSCGHTFHEFCIRGWCIVGKKQTCPYCKEKVDLKKMFCNPWEKPHVFYGQLLDWVRLLVAWQPAIILMVQGINNMLGLQ
ncbi:E3 ubiquitin ligase RNF121 [Oratosquilla oratoria]|uniref:E3 ubiquitin ligase RNF121 n=1 Tax=Oratosquilla oratoria TaxID=337810 RepID=UPI003F772FAA